MLSFCDRTPIRSRDVGTVGFATTRGTELTQTETASFQGTQTILFTDLEGSTDIRIRLGDTEANELFREHDRLVRQGIETGGGTNVKGLGDGFMALFSSASRAIETAVSIQRAIEAYNESNPEHHLSVRMGLNSGDVTHIEDDAQGTAVHAASRIAAKAQGDQILISQIVSDLAGSHGSVRLTDRGLFWLKGFPDRWRLYEVLWREKEGADGEARRETRETSSSAFDVTAPRSTSPIVGRKAELRAIEDQMSAVAAGAGLRALVLEGEAGIGKSRTLLAAEDRALGADPPFVPLQAAGDEELRGPFLMFRSLLASPRVAAMAREMMALEQLDRARDAIGGSGARDMGLSPQEQMLRVFDEVATAFAAFARDRPVALLLDDLQWADEDSIQLIRYLVKTLPTAPILLLIAIRPYSETSSGAGKLIADLDRMRVTKVVRLERLTRPETGELLQNVLGSGVDDQTLQSLHGRSEGVPFFIEELARAYREADALQLMDGTWTLTRLSGAAVPSSVQSLIERRLAQLSDDCRGLLADAGVLGRRFRLSDLAPVLARIRREEEKNEWDLADDLDGAVQYGLLVEEPDGSDYDFSFSHDQIRASLLADLPRRRQQAIHTAIVEVLESRPGDPDVSRIAYHSTKAGDSTKAVAAALSAARAALAASAPEGSIRLVDATLPLVSEPADRIEMLMVKDDAFELLDRGMERVANLAEMAALTGAVPDPSLDAEVKLRRASAARAIEDYDVAVDLASSVQRSSVEQGDLALELRACFESGQAHARSAIGEGYMPVLEVDLEGAGASYSRALDLARVLGDRAAEATALRELAMIETGIVKQGLIQSEAEGASEFELLAMVPTLFEGAKELASQAYQIFEEVGDQRGAMSALITLAYTHIADPTAHGMTGRIEHVRALQNNRKTGVTESQRASENALMLYSIHVYARLNIQPDIAIERGKESYEAARSIGDRWLEALSAGGMALTYASIDDGDSSSAWLDRASAAALTVPSPSMARRLEMWRGACAAARGDVADMQERYRRAADLASTKNPAGKAEALCALAMATARMVGAAGDVALLEQARSAAQETLDATVNLPEGTPWAATAHAVLAVTADAAGRPEEAVEEARTALTTFEMYTHLDYLVDVLWATGKVLITQQAPEAQGMAHEIAQGMGYLSMSMSDPDIRARWFEMSTHKELAELVGFELGEGMGQAPAVDLEPSELDLLRQITSGTGNGSVDDDSVSSLLAKLGVDSQMGAIEYAIKAGITWR